jgi:hypothetical protein
VSAVTDVRPKPRHLALLLLAAFLGTVLGSLAGAALLDSAGGRQEHVVRIVISDPHCEEVQPSGAGMPA